MIDLSSETAWLRGELRQTRVASAMSAVTRALSRGWDASAARRVASASAAAIHAASPAERVRAGGVWALAAALTDAALTPFDPRPATVSRWVLWAGLLVCGATATAFSAPVAAAWTAWRSRGAR